jgi:DNA primase
MAHDNLSFIEAVETLAAQAGMQVPQQSPQDVAVARRQKDLYALVEDAAKFFEEQLAAAPGARSYLDGRGVSPALAASFRLGYAPGDDQLLRKYLSVRGYADAQMIEAGLIKAREGRQPGAFFRERIMFPVADGRGRVVAFGGRILPENLRAPARGDHKPPKYINSPETPIFHKGRMLYSEQHARLAAAEGQAPIVVEGYLDVMACFDAGYKGAVAPLGTALTPEQVMLLWKIIPAKEKVPYLCFDGDAAGQRAAIRACDNILPLLQPDQSAKFIFLPPGHDPDTLLRGEGGQSFAALVENAMPLSEFIWQRYTAHRRLDTPEAQAGLRRDLEEAAAQIADRGVQQYYQQAFRDRLYKTFGPGARKSAYAGKGAAGVRGGKGGFGGRKPPAVTVPLTPPVADDGRVQERVLLAALVNNPEIFDEIEEDLGRMEMRVPAHDSLRQALLAALTGEENTEISGESGVDAIKLRTHLEEQGFAGLLAELLSPAVYTHAGFARPGSGAEKVLEGWRETCKFLQQKTAWKEIRAAGAELAKDFSDEKERRIMALHDLHKSSDS